MGDGVEQGLIAPHGGVLNAREATGEEARALEERTRGLAQVTLNARKKLTDFTAETQRTQRRIGDQTHG